MKNNPAVAGNGEEVSDLKPVLKALLAQARVNSHAMSVFGALAKNVQLEDDFEEFSTALKAAMQSNREFVTAISAAVDKLDEESNG